MNHPNHSVEQRLRRLEAGVQAAEAIRAIKRLQHSYGHYLGSGLWSDLADLFTGTATLQYQTGPAITGKDSIRQHFMAQARRESLGLAEGQLNEHLILQPIVTLGSDGVTAKGTWHEVAMLGELGSYASWRGGVYENEYALENGTWKISRLAYCEQYSGPYEEWGHKAPAKWNIPYHFVAEHVGVTIPESALRSLATSASAAPAERIVELARHVQTLNDETEVQNLQHAYGYYVDRKMWDDIADLFTEDGLFEVAGRGGYVRKPRIRQALEVFYGAPGLRPGELCDHIGIATVVTIAPGGQSAGARSTQLSMLGVNGEFAQWELGTYENEFVKEGGVWKMKAVRYTPRMTTDYDEGWGKSAKPAPAASKEFSPDRAPAEPCETYPKTHIVEFHYANPATGRAVQYPSIGITRVKAVAQSRDPSQASPAASTGADFNALLADLEHRLDAAIAVDAVENLNSSYGYYIDESAWDQMAATFASSGSKEITGAGVYVGPERIRHVLNLRGPRGGRTPSFFTIHQLTQPVIHISEDGKSAKARLRLFQCGGNADGSSGSWIGGIYENTAVYENGEWKFGAQDLHHLFNASYRNGWARMNADAFAKFASRGDNSERNQRGGGIMQGLGGAHSPARFAAEFPPDRPIRAKQYAFPEIVEPALHYKNPVTGRAPPGLLP